MTCPTSGGPDAGVGYVERDCSSTGGRNMKVMTIVGTRPEIIRLSRVIPCLDEHVKHVLVHTGQNYDDELNGVFFRDLGLRAPDIDLHAAGGTAAETIGLTIARIDPVLQTEAPDAVLILGDTNSSLAAIAAKSDGSEGTIGVTQDENSVRS